MTLGGRFWTKDFAPWDFEAEGAWQVGQSAGDDVSAWMAGVEGGYTFEDCAVKPRVWVGYEFASGDSDPTDSKVGTFNQMFPLGHAWFGYVDVVGRQNHFGLQIAQGNMQDRAAWLELNFGTHVGGQRSGGKGDQSALGGDLVQVAGNHPFGSRVQRSALFQKGLSTGRVGVEREQPSRRA